MCIRDRCRHAWGTDYFESGRSDSLCGSKGSGCNKGNAGLIEKAELLSGHFHKKTKKLKSLSYKGFQLSDFYGCFGVGTPILCFFRNCAASIWERITAANMRIQPSTTFAVTGSSRNHTEKRNPNRDSSESRIAVAVSEV